MSNAATPRARLLTVFSDELGYLAVSHLAHRPWEGRTIDIARACGVTAPEVSKRIARLRGAGVILRGNQHRLVDAEQTTRALREIDRLSIALQRWHLSNEKHVFYNREERLASRADGAAWPDDPDFRRRPVAMRWQSTDETGIQSADETGIPVLGPDEGVLVDETEPRALLNDEYLPFKMLITGLSTGGLEVNERRATRRAKRAIEQLVPPASRILPISRHPGWRDATEHVYTHSDLAAELRKYQHTTED